MNKKFFFTLIFIILVGIFLKPAFVNASNLYIEQPAGGIKVGEKVTLKVYFNSGNKEINVLEGSLKINGAAEISSIDTSSSIFSMWPNGPVISNQEISFVGGIPGGVAGEDLRVFDVSIVPTSAGSISFTSNEMATYLSDGLGTKLLVDPLHFEIKIGGQNIPKQNIIEQNITKNYRFLLIVVIIFLLAFCFYKILKNKKLKK